MIKIKTLKHISLILFTLITLPACSEDYIPLGEYRIEWDEYDPKLHGQVVQFNVPMAYVLLHESDIGDYVKEVVEVGRLLRTVEEVEAPGGELRNGYQGEKIKEEMEFTVKASYWHRYDWLKKELNGDIKIVIFVDENGIESIGSFYDFNLYSNRPDLAKYMELGK